MREELDVLIRHIEENLRASQRSGINFIDPKNYKNRLLTNQNHIIFGRRGAGKTSLIRALEDNKSIVRININIEDYKQITFPNIVIHLLINTFKRLSDEVKKKNPFYKMNFKSFKYRRLLKDHVNKLNQSLNTPDTTEENIRDLHRYEDYIKGDLKKGSTGISGGSKVQDEQEISKTVSKNKTDLLYLNLPEYKRIIQSSSHFLSDNPIYIILDDFYFLKKADQPFLIDYFHRLTKDTFLFLKIATIKHRTKIYLMKEQSYIGVELGHDIFDIDMDYTLDKFDELKSFMKTLLQSIITKLNLSIYIDNLFSGDGFNQLCLASGGVPRDFLSLFVKLANQLLTNDINRIGKTEVNEVAISNINNKYTSLKTDSAEETEILETYLAIIKAYVYSEKRTNTFLVAKNDLDEFILEKQALRELIDLRLLHLIETNTSKAPSDGLRYEAYILDVGLYDNSRPRGFRQITPGSRDEKSRMDDLRASPVLKLLNLNIKFKKTEKQLTLEIVNYN